MRESTRNVVIGLSGLVALAGFGALLMLFGEINPFAERTWPLPVALNDSGGLRAGSVVTLNGVPVGLVESVEVGSDPVHPVLIRAGIDEGRRLPRPLVPTIQGSLIGGGATLQLQTEPGATRMDDFYPLDGSELLVGQSIDLATRVTQTIGREAERLTQSLATFREGFDRLAVSYERLGNDLDDLVRPLRPGEEEAGVASLRITIARLNAALEEARGAVVDARRWLGDDALLGDVKGAVAEARSLMTDGRDAVQRYAALADSLKSDADRLVERLVPAADELARTLAEVRGLATLASRGDGTIASLLNKPDLYRSLLDASKRLEKALEETQLLVRKVKEEGLRLDLK